MAVAARVFSFDAGDCHLYPDRIEIRRKGLWGIIDRYLYERGIVRMAWFNGWLLAGALVFALVMLIIQNYFLTLFLMGMAGVIGWLTVRSWSVSFAPVIDREAIQEVEWHDAVPGVSRTAIVFRFERKGQLLNQVVRLARTTQGGEGLAEAARKMLRDDGLL